MIKLIKVRITIFGTVIVFVLFMIFGGLIYFGLESLLKRQFDRQMYLIADAIEDSYVPVENKFKYLEKGTKNFEQAKYKRVRVIQPDGSVFFQSEYFEEREIPFPMEEARQKVSKRFFYHDFLREDNRNYRSVIIPVINPDSTAIAWVEVSESARYIEASLSYFRKLLLASLPLVLIAVAATSFYVVNRLIRPVSLMARRAEEITFENLSQRLPVINPLDEVGRLAMTFNQLLKRLESAFRQHRQLLSNISHELKTPLTILRTHWETEISNTEIQQTTREKLAGDVEELARLSKMVDDLSLLSRSLEDLSNLQKEKLNIAELLNQLVQDIGMLAEAKSQTLHWVKEKDIYINGDRRYLKRLFLNLFDNAIKYTSQGKDIFVECLEKDRFVIIKVRDTGIGIPISDQPHIFDRFYRAKNTKYGITKGSGLGLPIVKWITEAHFGEIKLESQSGKGSTFIVSLPLWKDN